MTLLLTLLFKSLLVFAAAGTLLFLLRRSSAAARHLVCLLTLGAVLLLPLCSLSLPGWHLPVLTVKQSMEEPTPVRPSPALSVREGKEFGQETHQASSSVSAASYSASSLTGRTPAKQGGGFLTQSGGFLALNLLGLLLASARPLLGLWGIRRLSRRCVRVDDEPTLTTAGDCASLLGLQPPRLCRADVPVPMTWGWRRPVIVLPHSSPDWPDARLRSVLLHEMAHVKRRDWAGHRLADVACAVCWFHPLVWLTARRLRAESELACDDLVLASGVPAPDYARHLLEIASALPRVPNRSPAAIAMAQTSQIESRLHMILDKTRTRRTVARRVLIFALIPGTAALVTLAVLRPDAKAQTAPARPTLSTAATPFSGTLLPVRDLKLNGKSLLAGVTDANKPGGPWWSASGTVLPTPVYDTNAYRAENHASPDQHTVSFAFRLPSTVVGSTFQYHIAGCVESSSEGFWVTKINGQNLRSEAQLFPQTQGTRVVTAAFRPSLAKTTVQVGIAAGSWKTAAQETFAHSLASPSGGTDGDSADTGSSQTTPAGTFIFSVIRPEAGNASGLTVTTSEPKQDLRIVAMDTQGHLLLPSSIGGNSAAGLDQITLHFAQPPSQIKEIRVETRPFQWIEYKDVALMPVQ